MSTLDVEIKRIFSEEGNLPDVVRVKKYEAYDKIYDGLKENAKGNQAANIINYSNKSSKNKFVMRHALGIIPRVAVFIVAGILLVGIGATAKTIFKSRFERVNNMAPDEVKELRLDAEAGLHICYEYSRELTDAEEIRKDELEESYKAKETKPEMELRRLSEKEEYPGDGVYFRRATEGKENTIFIPDRELTDEELLEIIDYNDKLKFINRDMYEEYEIETSGTYNEMNLLWTKAFPEMTDEEVDYWFLAGGWGIFSLAGECRMIDGELHGSNDDTIIFSDEEQAMYDRLEREYYEEDHLPEKAITVITMPEEYTGEGVAACRYEGSVHVPSGELTEEDYLEIIDYWARHDYSLSRLWADIDLGVREDVPQKNW